MRFASLLLCATLLAGCAGHAKVRFGSAPTSVAPGTSVINSSVRFQAHSGSVAATLLGIGILATAWNDAESYGSPDRANHFPASGPAPPLDEWRRVNEQDCTRPIEDRSANLRCR